MGDKPIETLYDCYLLDVGQRQRISQRDIRVLPGYLTELPAPSKNSGERKDWTVICTNLIKELFERNTAGMEEEPSIVSVKDSPRQSSFLVDAAPKKFKPKYGHSKQQSFSLKHAPVSIISTRPRLHKFTSVLKMEIRFSIANCKKNYKKISVRGALRSVHHQLLVILFTHLICDNTFFK